MKRRSTRSAILFACLGVLVAGWAAAGSSLRQAVETEKSARAAGFDELSMRQRNESAFGQILGEVRTSVADLIFVKTNRYLHAGVGYAPRLRMDAGQDSRMFAACMPGTPTLIRGKSRDFRWFLGDLERQVKPYKDASQAHAHLTADELAPWYRVITLMNPNYIRAYRIGAKTLADERKWKQALAFLEEGVRNNPANPQLFLLFQSLGSFYMRGRYQTDHPWANEWSEKALAAVTKGYELALAQRPPFGQKQIARDILWSDDYEEDFRYCAHLTPLLLREQGRRREALAFARKAASECPGFRPLSDLSERLAAEPSVETARENAKD